MTATNTSSATSLPTRGARIETRRTRRSPSTIRVAPHAGGADRNVSKWGLTDATGSSLPTRGARIETSHGASARASAAVAPHAGGADRNANSLTAYPTLARRSPRGGRGSKRAQYRSGRLDLRVAPHAGGADRNRPISTARPTRAVAPHAGGADRNPFGGREVAAIRVSLPTRGARIETSCRRRHVWCKPVAPHAGGADRNAAAFPVHASGAGRSPRGGRGSKPFARPAKPAVSHRVAPHAGGADRNVQYESGAGSVAASLPTRGARIETSRPGWCPWCRRWSRSPRGGRGSKLDRPLFGRLAGQVAPHAGGADRNLKLVDEIGRAAGSLPTRGARIETLALRTRCGLSPVAPHAGGADRNCRRQYSAASTTRSLPTRGARIETPYPHPP